MSQVDVKLGITLQAACARPSCSEFAWPLLNQLDSGRYDEMSVVNLQPLEDWRADHRTARKRADRAERRGYSFGQFARYAYESDINAINQSASHRQGRPMSWAYTVHQNYAPLPYYPCRLHAIRDYGVFDQHHDLVAYSFIYRSGELALVSQILGHALHLEDEIMFLLVQGVMRAEHDIDPGGYLVYNRHDSGTPGLREFKEHFGFVPMGVEWLP